MGLLKKGFYFGFAKGKISCTPEQAQRMFGFAMKPEAKGVILRRYRYTDAEGHRKIGTFVNNYIPPSNPQTPNQMANRQKFASISRLALTHTTDLIKDIWQPLAERRTPEKAHGCNLFRGINMLITGTPYDPTKLTISDGDLEPTPSVISCIYDPDTSTYTITFDPTTTKNGLPTDLAHGAIHNLTTNDLWLLHQPLQARREDGQIIGMAHAPTGSYIVHVYLSCLTSYSISRTKTI